MIAPRFSLTTLLCSIAFIAFGCVALMNADALWGKVVFIAAFTSGAGAVLGVINYRGRRRAFWAGFAVFFWLYLLLPTYKPLTYRMSTKELSTVLHSYVSREITFGGLGNPPLTEAPDLSGVVRFEPLWRRVVQTSVLTYLHAA